MAARVEVLRGQVSFDLLGEGGDRGGGGARVTFVAGGAVVLVPPPRIATRLSMHVSSTVAVTSQVASWRAAVGWAAMKGVARAPLQMWEVK